MSLKEEAPIKGCPLPQKKKKKKMKLKGAHFKVFISSHIFHPKSSFSSLTWPKWEELLKTTSVLGMPKV
jgi:hypothetical protein